MPDHHRALRGRRPIWTECRSVHDDETHRKDTLPFADPEQLFACFCSDTSSPREASCTSSHRGVTVSHLRQTILLTRSFLPGCFYGLQISSALRRTPLAVRLLEFHWLDPSSTDENLSKQPNSLVNSRSSDIRASVEVSAVSSTSVKHGAFLTWSLLGRTKETQVATLQRREAQSSLPNIMKL